MRIMGNPDRSAFPALPLRDVRGCSARWSTYQQVVRGCSASHLLPALPTLPLGQDSGGPIIFFNIDTHIQIPHGKDTADAYH